MPFGIKRKAVAMKEAELMRKAYALILRPLLHKAVYSSSSKVDDKMLGMVDIVFGHSEEKE